MSLLLHIVASPKGEASASTRIAYEFIDEWQRQEGGTVRTLSLFDVDLPEFGRTAAEAKFAPLFGDPVTPEHTAAWDPILQHIRDFDEADKIVLSSPMWNGSIPYKLKHYFDLIMQPKVTFSYDREKMQHYGLLRNRPVQLVLTRSSIMPGDFTDFQLPFLRFAFDFMGIRDVRALCAWRTTKYTAEERESYIQSFFEEARAAARNF